MASKDCGDERSVICSDITSICDDLTPSCENIKGILHQKSFDGKHKTDKQVKIVEPFYVHEKKIREKRLKVEALIIQQMHKRRDEFEDLRNKSLPSLIKITTRWVVKFILLMLFLSMVLASICHQNNCRCEVYWYEIFLAGVFGIFTSPYEDDFPS